MDRTVRTTKAALAVALLAVCPACAVEDGEPSGTIPTPVATSAPTTKAALGEACKIPSDCDSGQCFVGGQFSYCSLKCGTDTAMTVCAPPVFNGVCNKQGFCRRP
jgi:hypothetical protein